MAEKIKMSSIREKFPMYGDIPDEQLLKAVREKFYPEIPMPQFVSRVDWDTQRERDRELYDPTKGRGGFENFVAGYGKAGADLARGAGQWLGAVSRDDVAESRKLDRALMNTSAGKFGNFTGNVAAMLPLAMLPGANTYAGAAAYGAATGALAPSESTEETGRNIGLGGVLGAGSIAAGRALGAGAKMVQGLVEPLTKRGQERVAASALQSFARDPASAAQRMGSAKPLVPGSMPTMAQASADPGLAQLERTLVNNPETGPQLAARFAEQRAARLGAVKEIAGTDEYYNAIKDGVRTFAKQDYEAAISAGFDPKALAANKDKLAKLLERPSIRSAQSVAQDLAAENGEQLAEVGSVKGLDYLVKALDNKISAAKNMGSSIGKEELRALVGTKNELMNVIEQVAPAYKKARGNFADMSAQVNSMDVARELLKKYEPALARYGANTREHSSAYASALDGALESTKKATGMDLPLNRFMPADDISTLKNVARDLGRKASTEEAGKAVGSNTAQNLAAQNLLRRTLGPTGLPQSWSESTALQTMLSPLTGLYKLGGAEQRIMDRLAQAALDPNDAAMLLMLSKQPGMLDKIGRSAEPFLPLLPRAGLFAQPQQQ